MPDLRPLFTEETSRWTHPGLNLTAVAASPRLTLDADSLGLLRDGLGIYDMEVHWLAHLDASRVLRLWRSRTGNQIYSAVVETAADGTTVLSGLMVEQHPERYSGELSAEPARFEGTLTEVLDILRRFRAGRTLHGSAPA
jgi:hypothetical protein